MTPATPKKIPMPTLSGWKYRATHKASVTAILGAHTRPVSSRGSMFMNVDRWTLRKFIDVFCKWCRDNDGACPTRDDVQKMVNEVDGMERPTPEIVIAHTPDELPQRIAMALVGGAYHEAWHTKYSRLKPLRVGEMYDIVVPRHAKVSNWGKYTKMLLQWANVADDIRIERVGRREYPGTEVKMHDLQDFILSVEEKGRMLAVEQAIKAKVPEPEKAGIPNTLSIVMCLFRDIGLGYNTNAQRLMIDNYKEWNPQACQLVLNGPLSEILRENIRQTAKDDLGCLRTAMDVVAELDQLSQDCDGEGEDGEPQEGQQGSLDKCPQCGAPDHKLKLRPKKDQKIKGASTIRGVITCTVCGWQTEVDLKKEKKKAKDKAEEQSGGGGGTCVNMPGGKGGAGGKGGKPQKGGIQAEGFDEWFDEDEEDNEGGGAGEGEGDQDGKDEGDEKEGKGGSKDGKDGDDGDEKGKGKGKKGDKDEDDSGKGAAGDGEDDGEDGDKDGEGSGGSGKDGEEDEGDFGDVAKDALDGAEDGADMKDSASALGEEMGGDGDEEGEKKKTGGDKGDSDNTPSTDTNAAKGAGGYHWDKGVVDPSEFNDVAKDIEQQAAQGATIKDSETALNEEFEEFDDKQQGRNVKRGEAPYRPYTMDKDSVQFVQPSTKGKADDAQRSDRLFKSVKQESSFLRSRFRNVFRALEIIDTTHGLRRGKAVSDRMLVDSKACMMAGELPNRAYYDVSQTIDTSVAACIVLDQSGSMSGTYQRLATQIMCAITEPLDAVGAAIQVAGFRNGSWGSGQEGYHRSEAIHHDIFKAFEERFKSVRWRFANTRATGSTPMSDGVQFALDALNRRAEAHRIVFVVTDGYPDHEHRPVIHRQIRIAKEAGVHVIGVGIGNGADYVKSLFVDHVWSARIEDMPKKLVSKLNELVDRRVSKRGKQIRSTA